MNENILEFTDKKYLSKRDIMYRTTGNITTIWNDVLDYRKSNQIKSSFYDKENNNFWYYNGDYLNKIIELEEITKHSVFEIVHKKTYDKILMESLIDEAFNSSLIEGAFTTKARTKELVMNKKSPKDINEQMVFNNYKAMEFVMNNYDKPITHELICDLQKIVTYKTLEKEDESEKYRDDVVYVQDGFGNTIHTAPKASKINELMDNLLIYINSEEDNESDIIKSTIIHFMMVYIHPFFDGNGRTARALQYFFLLKKGHNFFKFYSISNILFEEKKKYYKSILKSENEEADMTYFISFYMKYIEISIKKTIERLENENKKQIMLLFLKNVEIPFKIRLKKVILKITRRNDMVISTKGYSEIAECSQETARKDLNYLYKNQFFNKKTIGKKIIFFPDLKEIQKILIKTIKN